MGVGVAVGLATGSGVGTSVAGRERSGVCEGEGKSVGMAESGLRLISRVGAGNGSDTGFCPLITEHAASEKVSVHRRAKR